MHQPIYWPDHKPGLNRYQFAADSIDLKKAGGNRYAGDTFLHPRNALADEGGEYDTVFNKDDRVAIYQWRGRDAIQSLFGHPKAGVSISYSGALLENVWSLGKDWRYGYTPSWNDGYKTARGWRTTGGKPRADMVGMTFHHAFSPLLQKSVLRKEIQIFKELWWKSWGGNPDKSDHSRGFWPVEGAFSEAMIPVLRSEGYDWSIIANSHLARTCANYMDVAARGSSGWNIDPPNRADQVGPSVPANQWWSGTIDGRGGAFPAPFAYQAHKAKYVDPESGQETKITVVPMCDLLSYQNGYGTMGTGDIDTRIAPFNNPNQPSLVLMAHDGDNAWAGGFSYYNNSVPEFMNAAAGKGYEPSSIEQFLADHPVPDQDVVHVEDGGWVNAANDWGHPQYINWLWPPARTNGDPAKISTDPRTWYDAATGWTEDFRNWAVLVAGANYCETAEQITQSQGGAVAAWKIQEPYQKNGAYNFPNSAELAWHFYLGGLDSGFMYYGTSLDDEVKQTIACNRAIYFANQVIGTAAQDRTPPSVFKPQRIPWNPGGPGWGPLTGYKEVGINGKAPWPSDFQIWTHVHDVSGVNSVTLYVRADHDGVNPVWNNDNDTYAGGSSVGAWTAIPMNRRVLPRDNVGNNPQINFFESPVAMADTYWAQVTGFRNKLVDYYVSATDSRGNTHKSDIQHVWVGDDGQATNPPAIPQNVTAVAAATNRINVSWSAAAGATGYVVSRDGAPLASVASTSYADLGVTADSNYCYTVAATNAFGSSSSSVPACASTALPPAVPQNLQAVAQATNRVALSWIGSEGASGYLVLRGTNELTALAGTSYVDSNVVSGTTYCYTVLATNRNGRSAASAQACATTPRLPDVPTGLAVTVVSSNRLDLSWSASSGAVSYVVWRDGVQIGVTSGRAYSDAGLTPGSNFCYTVAASNLAGMSAASVETCASTPRRPLLSWVGSTYHWPFNGQITSQSDLWINTESAPKGAALSGQVSFSTNNGASWLARTMNPNGTTASNDLWHVNLGKFPSGSSILYAVQLTDERTNVWDTNKGAYFRATVNPGLPVYWTGNVYNWPPQGQITAQSDLWVNIESWPAGAAVSAAIVYSTNGVNWTAAGLRLAGRNGNNDWWHINLGKFPSKTSIQYAIKVVDGLGQERWANNNGANYRVTVN